MKIATLVALVFMISSNYVLLANGQMSVLRDIISQLPIPNEMTRKAIESISENLFKLLQQMEETAKKQEAANPQPQQQQSSMKSIPQDSSASKVRDLSKIYYTLPVTSKFGAQIAFLNSLP